MKVKALLYVGLLIALSGCTGMGVKNELSSSKEQAFKHAENQYLFKGKSAQHTKRMMAWINISKN